MIIKNIKSSLFTILVCVSPLIVTIGQNKNVVLFKKIIEPVEFSGVPNLRSKTLLQKKFFPDNQGSIEFFVDPSFKAEYGFRVTHLDNGDQIIEVKQIVNWKEIKDRLETEYPFKMIPKSLSKEEREEMNRINVDNLKKRRKKAEEVIAEYKIDSKNIVINESLASLLYDTYVHLIRDYDNRGMASVTQFDGSQITLRCVVDNEVWSFLIGNSFGDMKKLIEISNDIVKDAIENADNLNQEKYVEQLEKLLTNR
jgi:hypothetical protein